MNTTVDHFGERLNCGKRGKPSRACNLDGSTLSISFPYCQVSAIDVIGLPFQFWVALLESDRDPPEFYDLIKKQDGQWWKVINVRAPALQNNDLYRVVQRPEFSFNCAAKCWQLSVRWKKFDEPSAR
jgi:hypothetical protein